MITLRSTYDKLQAEYTTLDASHKATQAELLKVTEEKAELEKRIAELSKEPAGVAALENITKELAVSTETVVQLTDENTKLVAQVEAIKTESTNLEEMVAAKALEIASSQGVPPLSLKPDAQPSSSNLDNDLVGQYHAAADPRKFWVEHREELVAILKKR